jgi:lipoprotein-anchoring transpeptidase ErfK/SrfK
MRSFWPADAKIAISMPIAGVGAGEAAGRPYAFDDDLSLDFTTGPEQVVTVDDRTHRLTVRRDGRTVAVAPVSLGASRTPTLRGVKVIMQKLPTTCMHNAGTYYECGIKDDQQLTYSGEYLHAAPWNVANIQRGVDSSNGCTNLLPDDAAKLYESLHVGDVVEYPNASGPAMSMGQGYGDWNVTWSQWLTGGAVRTA